MFQIISDGGCDFTKEEALRHNVEIVPFYVTFDGETHLKEGVDITNEEFFIRLSTEKNLFPKTSQPTPQDYINAYEPYLKAGKNIISLTISSKLSGTYNSATLAANMMKEEYPNRTILVIDSLNCAVGQGLILREIIKMRDNGIMITKAADIAKEIIKTTRIYFTLDSLEYLRRGGRVGPTTAFVGNLLGLRPVLHIVDGAVEQLESVQGKKKVLQLMEDGIVDALKDDLHNVSLCIGHILRNDDAIAFKASIEGALGTKITNPIAEIDATIGTHAGPGALAVAYCKKYESLVRR
ncbi:MAG: DegV family protein [Defluviitaleaceae bacterium]|nr:DegV family protein [Defluviitaleaceae bacterium]